MLINVASILPSYCERILLKGFSTKEDDVRHKEAIKLMAILQGVNNSGELS